MLEFITIVWTNFINVSLYTFRSFIVKSMIVIGKTNCLKFSHRHLPIAVRHLESNESGSGVISWLHGSRFGFRKSSLNKHIRFENQFRFLSNQTAPLHWDGPQCTNTTKSIFFCAIITPSDAEIAILRENQVNIIALSKGFNCLCISVFGWNYIFTDETTYISCNRFSTAS